MNILIIGIVCFLLGFIVSNKYYLNKRSKNECSEREVLTIVKLLKGEVTPLDIASESYLTVKEAKAILDKFNDYGFASCILNEDNEIIYKFSRYSDQKKLNESHSKLKDKSNEIKEINSKRLLDILNSAKNTTLGIFGNEKKQKLNVDILLQLANKLEEDKEYKRAVDLYNIINKEFFFSNNAKEARYRLRILRDKI